MKYYKKKQFLLSTIPYAGQLIYGYAMGWSAPVLPKLADIEQTPLPDLISEGTGSWIGSVLYLGLSIGGVLSGFTSSLLGRKRTFIIAGALNIAAFLILAFPLNVATILVGRIISGMGISFVLITNVVYLGEIGSKDIRGQLLTQTTIFNTLGILTVYAVGPFVSYLVMNIIGLALSVIYLFGVFFLPESPYYNMLNGKEKEAKSTFDLLGRDDYDEVYLTTKSSEEDNSDGKIWKEMITVKSNRRALIITLVLYTGQQLAGITSIVFFATSIFEIAESSIEPHIATIIIGATEVVFGSITPFLVERVGRKILLLNSSAICTLSLFVLGTFFYLQNQTAPLENIKWLPLASLIVYFIGFETGLGIIPATLAGELFQSKARSVGSSASATTSMFVGFALSSSFEYKMIGLGGHVTFWFYGVASAFIFLFTLLFVPETKGKSLLEIREMLSK